MGTLVMAFSRGSLAKSSSWMPTLGLLRNWVMGPLSPQAPRAGGWKLGSGGVGKLSFHIQADYLLRFV